MAEQAAQLTNQQASASSDEWTSKQHQAMTGFEEISSGNKQSSGNTQSNSYLLYYSYWKNCHMHS